MLAVFLATLLAAPFHQTWSFSPRGTPRVKVMNINGDIEIATKGRSVEITAHGKDAGQFTAQAVEENGEITVGLCCGDDCSLGRGRRRNRHRDRDCSGDGQIDFKLTVPEDTDLEVANVSGDIRVEGVAGPQHISNVSGNTRTAGSAGEVHVSTVSGDVELEPGRLAETDLSSVSGDITLRVPRNANATVKLSSLSGEIRGDVGEGSGRRRVIGSGHVKVRASSVSGGINLRQ